MKVTGKSSRRTVRGGADRRKRFRAALGIAGLTQEQFATSQDVTGGHLSQVLSGDRDSAKLTAAIDAFIVKQLGKEAA